jgi:hypothetical protein
MICYEQSLPYLFYITFCFHRIFEGPGWLITYHMDLLLSVEILTKFKMMFHWDIVIVLRDMRGLSSQKPSLHLVPCLQTSCRSIRTHYPFSEPTSLYSYIYYAVFIAEKPSKYQFYNLWFGSNPRSTALEANLLTLTLPICLKARDTTDQLVNFITCGCESSAPFL